MFEEMLETAFLEGYFDAICEDEQAFEDKEKILKKIKKAKEKEKRRKKARNFIKNHKKALIVGGVAAAATAATAGGIKYHNNTKKINKGLSDFQQKNNIGTTFTRIDEKGKKHLAMNDADEGKDKRVITYGGNKYVLHSGEEVDSDGGVVRKADKLRLVNRKTGEVASRGQILKMIKAAEKCNK